MKVQVYLNAGKDHFFGFRNGFADSPELHLAAEFELDLNITDSAVMDEDYWHGVLEMVYAQLNVGGELIPATEWTTEYRAAGHRSLSVGDVVVVGGLPYAVASLGWETAADYLQFVKEGPR